MAQKLAPPPVPDPLAPGTFRSLLPTLDDLLTIIRSQSTSANPPSPVEASEAVAAKVSPSSTLLGTRRACTNADNIVQARELDTSLESMRTAALNLPGGHLSTARLQELSEMLEDEAENRR